MNKPTVDEIRDLMIAEKKLSSWHANMLMNFAFIAFNNVKSVKIDYSFENAAVESKVRYIITKSGKLGTNKAEIEKRMADCTGWVRSIFWSDMKVEFALDNGKALVSERKPSRNKKLSG